jgi:Zn-finger nucleic acid-binding protein
VAQRVITQMICDKCGAESADATTISYGVGRSTYEMDLCAKCNGQWDKAIQPFLELSRRTSAGRGRPAGYRATQKPEPVQRDWTPKEVRTWAAENEIEIPARGRIPESVVTQFLEAPAAIQSA